MKTEGLLPIGYRFEEFRIDLERRILFRAEEPVALSAKAFDVMVCLVAQPGTVLEKETLLKLVWPDTFVEEANLTVHISTLRKVLGEVPGQHRFIVTVPKRGYRFVADVTQVVPAQTGETVPAVQAPIKPSQKPGGLSLAALVLGLAAVIAVTGFGLVRQGLVNWPDRKSLPKNETSESVEAQIACEKGWYLFHKGVLESPRRGLFFFQQALAQNPNSANALAGLANTYCRMAIDTGDAAERRAFLKQAHSAAATACSLDPDNAEAHSAQALLAMMDQQNPLEAEREHVRALTLNPNSALAHVRYSWFLFNRKNFAKAEEEAQIAARLKPVSLVCQNSLARLLFELGKFPEAAGQCQRMLDFEPGYEPALILRGRILVEQKRFAEAIEVLEPLVDFDHPDGIALEAVSTLAIAWVRAGRPAEAYRALDFFATYPTIYSGFHRLLILQELGETTAVCQELTQISQTGGPSLMLANQSPRLTGLRANPQVQKFFQNQFPSN
ncbi:MAG: winged helix-turn-helix domain-containing protein [Blastocatellia bacterium]|nr:winged helix-turn-helix domain-containing protein [Blastocatellia bacterium]